MQYLRWSLSVVFLITAGQASAQTSQDVLAYAQDAYKASDEAALARYAARLHTDKYVLAPYVDYWQMLLRLDQADPAEVRDFLARYADLPFSERTRIEWLKKLGKRGSWPLFFEELPRLQKVDAAVSCYALLGRAVQDGEAVLQQGKPIWLQASSQPEECDPLFDRMIQSGTLTAEDIWARVHLALEAGNISVAKSSLRRLPGFNSADDKLLDDAYENPQRVLQKKKFTYSTRLGRELNLYALERVSRSQPELALELWKDARSACSPREQRALWARMALHASRRHDPRALPWYANAEDAPLSQEQVIWKARAALRAKEWEVLLGTISAMPPALQEDEAWRYWKGRALKEKGQIAAANAVLLPLSSARSFYGLLAEEELGATIGAQPLPVSQLGEAEVQEIGKQPGIQRALEFYRLDKRWEGRQEWRWTIRDYDDKKLIAAAELAFRQQLYDVAIHTADQTTLTHDFALRYPTPYRDMMQTYARENALDEAWVYGLIRQESRFISGARSSVGASGLMQVMPATAKWIAKRLGLNNYSSDAVYQIETNIRFGTHYLRYTLDRADGQALMATAAYNAGPSRARRWQGPQALEGAIYAETIPFSETRGYVQKVMSNAYFYARRLGTQAQSLKQRLGMVAGTADAATAEAGEGDDEQ